MVSTVINNESVTQSIPSYAITEDMTIQIPGRGFTSVAHVARFGDLIAITNNPQDDEVLAPIAQFDLDQPVHMLVTGY